jgi:hypothetical protein
MRVAGVPPVTHWADPYGSDVKEVMVMSIDISRGTFVGLVVLSIACGRSTPTAPTASSQSPAVPSPSASPPTNFPALSGPSRTFAFDHELTYPVHDYTKRSRFVLYDNGAFALQYLDGQYRGGYTESNGVITFQWEGWSSAGPWSATGTLRDGSMSVQYNLIMGLSDFEDAMYGLKQ